MFFLKEQKNCIIFATEYKIWRIMQNGLTYTLDILDEAIKAAHEDTLFETRDIDVLMKSLMEWSIV